MQLSLEWADQNGRLVDMSPREADKIIKAGKPVRCMDTFFKQEMTLLFVARDRWNIFTDTGGVYDRGELEVLPEPSNESR